MEITLDDIKVLCSILIEKAKLSGIKKISFDMDNYWIISSSERENLNTDNPKVDVGSLYDDIESINKVLDGSNQPSIIDFDRLASILVAVGEHISKSKNVF